MLLVRLKVFLDIFFPIHFIAQARLTASAFLCCRESEYVLHSKIYLSSTHYTSLIAFDAAMTASAVMTELFWSQAGSGV